MPARLPAAGAAGSAWPRLECPEHALGIASDDGEVGPRGLVGFATSLLPVAQGAQRDMVPGGKFLLGQPESAPQRLGARHRTRRLAFLWVHRPRIGIAERRGLDPVIRHPANA